MMVKIKFNDVFDRKIQLIASSLGRWEDNALNKSRLPLDAFHSNCPAS